MPVRVGDPLVAGVEKSGDVGVAEHRRGQAFAPADDGRPLFAAGHGQEDRLTADGLRHGETRPPDRAITPMTDHDFSRWRPHPWHGLDLGSGCAPHRQRLHRNHAFRHDQVRDRQGLRATCRVDRPQRYVVAPAGAVRVHPADLLRPAHREAGAGLRDAAMAIRSTSAWSASGPSSVRSASLRARVIGGIKLIDRGEADDKIIGVLEGDYVWDHVQGHLAARARAGRAPRALLQHLQDGAGRT